MAYTTTQLATAVLKHLAIADASETPDTADLTYCTDTYAQMWEELASHGTELAYWAYDDIPAPVFLILRDLLALEVMGAFGKPIGPAEKDAQKNAVMMRLRKHTQMQSANRPVTATYF